MYMKMTWKTINAYEKKKESIFKQSTKFFFSFFFSILFFSPSPAAPLTPASVSILPLSLLGPVYKQVG